MSLLLLLSHASAGGTVYADGLLASVLATDGMGAAAGFSGAVYDSISVTDTQAGRATLTGGLTEAVSLADSYASTGTYVAGLIEQSTLSDSVSPVQVFSATLGSGVSLVDSYAGKASFSAYLIEQLALADAYTLGSVTYTDALTEQVTLSDGAVVHTIIAASLGEAIAVADSLGASQISVSALGESLLLNASFFGIRVGLTWPAPADVMLGVQYGPTGSEYTGTANLGVGATIFASQFTVSMQTQEMQVMQMARREAARPTPPPDAKRIGKSKKNVFVTTATPQLHVTQVIDEICVMQNTNKI